MSASMTDNLQKTDCINCRVNQQSYGRFCAYCHFARETQEKLRLVMEEEENARTEKLRNIFAWIVSAAVFAIAVYVWSFFEK